MEKVRLDDIEFCIPSFDETPLWEECNGLRVSHPGIAVKNPKIKVKVSDLTSLIYYILFRPPYDPIENPLAIAASYEPIPSLSKGISFDSIEDVYETIRSIWGKEPTGGIIKSPEDTETLIIAAWYASITNKRLEIHEGPLMIDGEEIEEDPKTLLTVLSSIVYSIATKAFAYVYNTKKLGMHERFGPAPVPIVFAYGDDTSKALAAAYAAHRGLPLIFAESIPTVDLYELINEFEDSKRSEKVDFSDFVTYYKLLTDVQYDPHVVYFLKRYLPSRIVYFSSEPVVHGLFTDRSDTPAFLGSFIPEFRIPTDNIEYTLQMRSQALAVPHNLGKILVVRNSNKPDLTAYAPAIPLSKLAEEGIINLIELYRAYLKTPEGEEVGLDALEGLIQRKRLSVSENEIKKVLSESSFIVLESYTEYIDGVPIPFEDILGIYAPEVPLSRPPITIAPVYDIPETVTRRYGHFLVDGLLKDANIPAAMAYAKSSMHIITTSDKVSFSRRKKFLMEMLSMTIQAIGFPDMLVIDKKPTRYVGNLSVLLNAAMRNELIRMDYEYRNIRKKFGDASLKIKRVSPRLFLRALRTCT